MYILNMILWFVVFGVSYLLHKVGIAESTASAFFWIQIGLVLAAAVLGVMQIIMTYVAGLLYRSTEELEDELKEERDELLVTIEKNEEVAENQSTFAWQMMFSLVISIAGASLGAWFFKLDFFVVFLLLSFGANIGSLEEYQAKSKVLDKDGVIIGKDINIFVRIKKDNIIIEPEIKNEKNISKINIDIKDVKQEDTIIEEIDKDEE